LAKAREAIGNDFCVPLVFISPTMPTLPQGPTVLMGEFSAAARLDKPCSALRSNTVKG